MSAIIIQKGDLAASSFSNDNSNALGGIKVRVDAGSDVAVAIAAAATPDATDTVKGKVSLAVAANHPSTSNVEAATPAYVAAAIAASAGGATSIDGLTDAATNASSMMLGRNTVPAGGDNTSLGMNAAPVLSTGNSNVAIGRYALFNGTSASTSVAIGWGAVGTATSAGANTGVGYATLQTATGSSNTAVGSSAGQSVTTGGSNTFVGVNAGTTIGDDFGVTTGSNNTVIGMNAGASSPTVSNEVTIGNTAVTATRLRGLVSANNFAGKVNTSGTIDVSTAELFARTGSAAYSFTGAVTGLVYSFVLELTNGAGATFPGVKWEGGTAPTLTASGVDILGFYTRDGGTTWRGIFLSKDNK